MFLGESSRDVQMTRQDFSQSLTEKDLQDVSSSDPYTPCLKLGGDIEIKQPDKLRQEKRYIIKPYLPPDVSD